MLTKKRTRNSSAYNIQKGEKLDQTKILMMQFFFSGRRVGSFDHHETGFQLPFEIQNFLIVLRICNIFCIYLHDLINNKVREEGAGQMNRQKVNQDFLAFQHSDI